MKKLVTLLLAAGMVFAASAPSSAIEIKPRGQAAFEFMYNHNLGSFETGSGRYAFQDSGDAMHNYGDEYHPKRHRAVQRFILEADIIASESLQAHIDFICGFFTWGGPNLPGGGAAFGGNLGGRANNIITRQAYLDWFIPNTKAKVRMGLFLWVQPQYAAGSINFFDGNEFATGIQVHVPFNDNIGATFGWLRATSDSARANANNLNTHRNDLYDLFTLAVPVKFNGFSFTPWGMYGDVGKDSSTYAAINYPTLAKQPWGRAGSINHYMPLRNAALAGAYYYSTAHFGATAPHDEMIRRGDSSLWAAGMGGEVTLWDPFRFAFDFGYSQHSTAHSWTDRAGWVASAMASYKTKWGVPTIKGWYSSGDDSNVYNGSERAVTKGGHNTGAIKSLGGGAINPLTTSAGGNMAGTWGVSLQWNNMSFVKDLTHNFHITYIGGTNHKNMAGYADPQYISQYLTTRDSLVEINFETVYKIYQNLSLGIEMAYIFENFDRKVWGVGRNWDGTAFNRVRGNGIWSDGKMKFSDAAFFNVGLRYTF